MERPLGQTGPYREKDEGQHLDVAIAECGIPWFAW